MSFLQLPSMDFDAQSLVFPILLLQDKASLGLPETFVQEPVCPFMTKGFGLIGLGLTVGVLSTTKLAVLFELVLLMEGCTFELTDREEEMQLSE